MAIEWLSIVEYARAYNVSDMTIRRRIKTGKLNAELRDGKYFIPCNSVDQQINVTETPKARQHTITPHQRNDFIKPEYYRPRSDEIKSVPDRDNQPPLEYDASSQVNTDAGQLLKRFSDKSPVLTNKNNREFFEIMEKFMKKISQNEKEITLKFEAKVQYLEEQIKLKNVELSQLHQKTEDLELLVKLLENKSK